MSGDTTASGRGISYANNDFATSRLVKNTNLGGKAWRINEQVCHGMEP